MVDGAEIGEIQPMLPPWVFMQLQRRMARIPVTGIFDSMSEVSEPTDDQP